MSEDFGELSPSGKESAASGSDGNSLAVNNNEAEDAVDEVTSVTTTITESAVKEEKTEINPALEKMGNSPPETRPDDSLVHTVTATSTVTEVIPSDPTQPRTVVSAETKVADEVAPLDTNNSEEETMELSSAIKQQPAAQSISNFSLSDNMEVEANSNKALDAEARQIYNDRENENEEMEEASDAISQSENSGTTDQNVESSEEGSKSNAEAGKENSQGSTQPLSAEREEPIV